MLKFIWTAEDNMGNQIYSGGDYHFASLELAKKKCEERARENDPGIGLPEWEKENYIEHRKGLCFVLRGKLFEYTIFRHKLVCS